MLRLVGVLNRRPSTYRRNLEDDYQVLSVLGQGSTSRVFLGIDIRDYHKVVLKLFKPMDEAKIRREIDILEQLKNCPNIVPLESVFRNEGSKNYTFVMPHYPGTTLNYIIKSLDVKQMKTFMQNILTAISFIHKQGIMHRDIKPSNILVCSNPTGVGPSCRIFDFGLAERYTPGQQYKHTIGTKCYKPPEILLKRTIYTPKIDIWCAGLILAEMVYQMKPLFPYLNDEEAMIKQVFRRCKNSWDIMTELQKETFGKIKYLAHKGTVLCPKGAELSELMMDANPTNRPTADEALKHPFFKT